MNRGKPQRYITLADEIMAMTVRDHLQSGDPLPPERKLAELFACNHLTIRKALRLLREQNRIHSIPCKGSFLGQAAKSAPDKNSNRIGFIFPDDEIFYYRIFAAVEKVLASQGLHPVVHLTRNSEQREAELLEYFTNSGTLALLAVPNRQCAELYKTLKIPTVIFDMRLPDLEIPQILSDDHSGAYAATEKLLQLGHQRIAHIGSEYDYTGEQRLNGYLDALKKYGIEPRKQLIKMRYPSREWGYHAIRELFAAKNPPTAVFCANDTIAAGVVNFCADNAISIPEDLSITGFGNTQTAEDLGLCSVSQNADRICGELCSALQKLLKKESIAPLTVIPTFYIARGSIAAKK